MISPEHRDHYRQSHDREKNHQHQFSLARRVGEDSEGRAAVLYMGQVHETGNHSARFVEWDTRLDHGFGDLVDREDGQRDQEMIQAHRYLAVYNKTTSEKRADL